MITGVGGGMEPGTPDFIRLDEVFSSPLCVVLGLAAASVAWRALGSARE
jgi:hypothetical protein